MSLPLPFRSPLSIVIDYFTNGDSSGEPLTTIPRRRFWGQCGSGSGGATEDVTRGIVGNGEQEGSSSSRNPVGVGTVTMEEAEDMVPLGEVPLDDVLGLAHGRGNSSSNVQQVAKWMEQIIPFSLLLFIVIVRRHWQGTVFLSCMLISPSNAPS
ncbi:hypothetical protein SESBI_29413 [Sesbania bispinosa]|nr:hypothetical protein SESBI_29413 [Sesbania bispinosa]